MPPRDVYIEPIPGGGAIMNRKPLAVCYIDIDLDHGATQWLHVLTDGSPALEFLRRKRGRCGCSRQGPPWGAGTVRSGVFREAARCSTAVRSPLSCTFI